MTTINVRNKDPYYSQRNNLFTKDGIEYASRSCQVTAMVSALDYCGYTFPEDKEWNQPEDSLLNFIINSPDVDRAYQKIFPDEYKKYIASGKNPKISYPPEELHSLLSLGTNLWMGKISGEITHFRYDCSLKELVLELVKGKPCVTSGLFLGRLRHVVCLVGVNTLQELVPDMGLSDVDLSKIDSFIIEDPYGDYHTEYKDYNGKDVIVPISEYREIFHTVNKDSQWAHLFNKA